ncbi:hypothetical protein B0H67DRAFT_494038 [Lasiosphaeris hirsuta]|uniref:MIF4G domain-containing protein n=1 Tax=Lasiosphaeris hirsuta TaxID=260670 RepID=A0AA40DQ88_9PEZI|nr:hypothetical protein B0H67DRAFT_494038 [Lasiosphaeris hirsuta]
MTSTASQPNQNPAPTPSAATSYASAAGATKKQTSTPLIATGSHPPVVVGSSAPVAQNGKSSVSSVNGRPNITPAVPAVVGAPAVRSSVLNGGPNEHSRKSSVTISANAPSSHIANGGPVGGHKAIPQFGFNESPAVTHSTPQTGGAAPIPIPGSNIRVPSPAHSPSPIPQIPQQSGGQRAPSSTQAPVTFGSFPGDNDRHIKQHSVSHNPAAMGQSPHARRDSQASAHNESVGHGGPGHNRGGYQGQGRGRGNFNQYNNNQTMGFPPSRPYAGQNAGRGGMQPHYQGRGGMQQYPNSPQPHRASPAPAPAMLSHGTPTMAPAALASGQPFYPPNMNMYPPHQQQQKQIPYGVPPQQMSAYRPDGMMVPTYPPYPQQQMPYMAQPPQSNPAFHQPFVPAYNQGQTATPMSRNPSQVSDRPTSSTGQSQAPVIAQGTPHQRPAQVAAPAIVSSTFSRPKKSAPLVIKDAQGKIVDFSQLKAPASPAPSIQQSKTPPVVATTPTPPPKAPTPSHARSESTSAPQKGEDTAEQRRNAFMNAVKKTIEVDPTIKQKEEEAAKAAAEKVAAEKVKEEQRLKEEERLAAEKKAEEVKAAKAAEEAKAREQAEAEKAKAEAEKVKAEAEAAKAEAEAEAAKAAAKTPEVKGKTPEELEEEDLERIIREMEEEDARREKEQAEISARKKIEAEERKKREEASKAITAAENDRKLREQEREMERLEEERERKRSGKSEAVSVADLLSKKLGSLELSDKDTSMPPPAAPTDKSSTLPQAKIAADKQKSKPVPLNLSPLNTTVEAPQPSAALQSLKTSRFLPGVEYNIYPAGVASPNPALNAAVHKKGKVFKYDAGFLLQFQTVFTEQPSLEFHQQVKNLIGDSDGSRSASARTPGVGSGRQGSRAGGAPGGFPQQGTMGNFGSAAKALPSGTTSEQRFAMSQGNSAPRPAAISGMAFGRSAFPGPLGGRTPSSTGNAGIPNSPRQGSKRGGGGGGGGSRRTDFGGGAQAAKTMPLTQGLELKPIVVSATGWKPISITNKAAAAGPATGHLDPELVQRKVKAALNKMTPEKFDKISDGILQIASQSKNEQDGRTLRQVIQLTFEKATDEAHWASMYAKFCKRMLEMMSPEIRDEGILDKNGNVVSGGALFRKYLLNRCQEEFERGWKVDLPEPQPGADKKAGEAVLLSDEYYIAAAAKRRGLGLVQFIGELFKLGMLTERIMHECVRKLLEFQGIPDEAEIESLTKLLRTVGGNLDSTDKGRPMMEAYFQRIDTIVNLPDLPSRLKFMLMDIIDLRRMRWASKDTNKGPKTLDEVRAEAEAAAAQKAADNARSNQRGGPGGRPPQGRGDARQFSTYTQPVPNQVGMDDLRRLKASGSRSSSQNVSSFGPTSMFNSRSNSGRRMGPGGAFGRGGEDSGASSRTGTPPTRERDSVAHTNAFGYVFATSSVN